MIRTILIKQFNLNRLNLIRSCSSDKLVNSNLIKNEEEKRSSIKKRDYKSKYEMSNLKSIIEEEEEDELILRKEKKSSFVRRKEIFEELEPKLKNDYRIKKMEKFYNDELIENLDKTSNINELLNVIEPFLDNKLRPDHLELIYFKINQLGLELKESNNDNLNEFNKFIKSSPIYNLLLYCTFKMIRELDNRTLTNALITFSLIKQNSDNKVVISVIEMLKHKLNSLELDEIKDCLLALKYYYKETNLNNFIQVFSYALLEIGSSKILSNKYDYENIEFVIEITHLFLYNKFRNKFRTIDHLLRPFEFK